MELSNQSVADDDDDNLLQQSAEAFHNKLQRKGLERPLFIEFSGTPKSGKSTCIDIVAHFFRRMEFRILAPTEGASKRTPYYLKSDLVDFNAWSMSYALTHMLEGLHSSERYEIAILDRGLFDALVWFQLLATRKDVTQGDLQRIQDFILIEKWRSVIDMVFLFKADPEASMERESRDKLIKKEGGAMNPAFLTELNRAYDEVETKFSAQFRNFEHVDTSGAANTTPKGTARQVVRTILATSTTLLDT